MTAANPAANSTVVGPDLQIRLRFNARIDQNRSRLVLLKPGGDLEPIPIHSDLSPDTLAGAGRALSPGSYRLRWQVLAEDGHVTRGEIPFRVRAP